MLNSMIKKFPWSNTDCGLLILRIGVGAIFITTGWIKFSDLPGTVGFFAALGFSAFWAYLVTAIELLGGLSVLLGFYTRIAAALLGIVMLVAIYELRSTPAMLIAPVSLLFSAAALKMAGPGKYSIKD